jgi:hypothetical protein
MANFYKGWITVDSNDDIKTLQELGVIVNQGAITSHNQTLTLNQCTLTEEVMERLNPYWGQWVWGLELVKDGEPPPLKRPKHEIVIEALLNRQKVKLGDYTYKLFHPGDEVTLPGGEVGTAMEFWLGCQATSNEQPVWIGVSEMSIVAFLNQARKLSNEEVTLLAANIALAKSRP